MTVSRKIITLFITGVLVFGPGTSLTWGEIPGNIVPAAREIYSDKTTGNYQVNIPLSFVLDNWEMQLRLPPVINSNGHILISIDDIVQLFACDIDFADNNQLFLYKDGTEMSFRVNEYSCLKNAEIFNIDTAPLVMGDDIYLPLRIIAEQLDYKIIYQADAGRILLLSQAGQARLGAGSASQTPVTKQPESLLSIEPPPINLPPPLLHLSSFIAKNTDWNSLYFKGDNTDI
ncbi:MAG: copper amine oxidase N-terminal domain-containing protein [Syntrophomonas sp.]